MDKQNEPFDAIVKRVFGPEARLTGSVGTGKGPGHVRILVDRVLLPSRVLGIGPTFEAALQDAQRQVTKDAAENPDAF